MYITQPFTNLESLFKSNVKSKDKERYDTILFVHFKVISLMIIPINDALNDKRKLTELICEYTGKDVMFISGVIDVIKKEAVGFSKNQMIASYITLIMRYIHSFKVLPKSGFFCSRAETASNWLNGFIAKVGKQADDLNIDYLNAWSQNLWWYLLNYHNDIFFKMNNESDNETGYRIIDELIQLVNKREYLYKSYI